MSLFKKIKQELVEARKAGHKDKIKDLQVVLGEFARLKGLKNGTSTFLVDDPEDHIVVKVLKQIAKSEKTTEELAGKAKSSLRALVEQYLPSEATEEEILEVLKSIDFDSLKNKMQAVGIIKKHFVEKGIDPNAKLISELVKRM